jgi:hypothetical protein
MRVLRRLMLLLLLLPLLLLLLLLLPAQTTFLLPAETSRDPLTVAIAASISMSLIRLAVRLEVETFRCPSSRLSIRRHRLLLGSRSRLMLRLALNLGCTGTRLPRSPGKGWTQAIASHGAFGFRLAPSTKNNVDDPRPQRTGLAAHPTCSAVQEVGICTSARPPVPPVDVPLRSRLSTRGSRTDLGPCTLLPLLSSTIRRDANCTRKLPTRHAVEDRRKAPLTAIATDRAPRPLGAAATPHEGVELPRGEGAGDVEPELEEVDHEEDVDVADIIHAVGRSGKPRTSSTQVSTAPSPFPPSQR